METGRSAAFTELRCCIRNAVRRCVGQRRRAADFYLDAGRTVESRAQDGWGIGTLMSFLDLITNSGFKVNDCGQVAFYPWGILGKGHILGGDEIEKQVRRFVRRFLLSVLGLVFLTIVTVGPVFGILWLPFGILFYWWRVNRLPQGCETTG